jgi:hypothetical protein
MLVTVVWWLTVLQLWMGLIGYYRLKALAATMRVIQHVMFQVKKAPPPEPSAGPGPSEAAAGEGEAGDSSNAGEGQIAIGKLRGEDYNFEFQGKAREGKMHFRLFMTQVGGMKFMRKVRSVKNSVYSRRKMMCAGGVWLFRVLCVYSAS